jgi:hypothetical protein
MGRLNVYVDAFNLYYGCIRDTPYRWLDLHIAIASSPMYCATPMVNSASRQRGDPHAQRPRPEPGPRTQPPKRLGG